MRGALVFKQNATVPNYQEFDWQTWAKVTFAHVEYDTDAIFDAANHQFVVPEGVEYVRLSGQLCFVPSPDGDRQILITKNNALFPGYAAQNTKAISSTTPDLNVTSPILKVEPGDTFQLQATHTRYNRLSLNNTAGSTWFQMEILG